MDRALEPFAAAFMQRALVVGLLVALTCSLIGTWVVLRGLSFMGAAGPCMAGTAVAGFFAVLALREALGAARHITAAGEPAPT